VLLTGATGFVGMELLCRYLEQGDRNIYALVRADDSAEAKERLGDVIENVCGKGNAHHDR
jgi:thioester reductase-like protein